MKAAIFHPAAIAAIRLFPADVRRELGKAIFDLQRGEKLSMPVSRPMPSVAAGVEELRIPNRSGIYRAFYYAKSGARHIDIARFHEEDAGDVERRYRAGKKAPEGVAP